jgi:hypothetical protein
MATKEQLSEEMDDMLDTDIQWEELKKEDLELLVELVDEGHLIEPMLKHVASEKSQDKVDEMIDNWEFGYLLSKVM